MKILVGLLCLGFLSFSSNDNAKAIPLSTQHSIKGKTKMYSTPNEYILDILVTKDTFLNQKMDGIMEKHYGKDYSITIIPTKNRMLIVRFTKSRDKVLT